MAAINPKHIYGYNTKFDLALHESRTPWSNWVIELKHLQSEEVIEMHTELDYERAVGVFRYLMETPAATLYLAEQYIKEDKCV